MQQPEKERSRWLAAVTDSACSSLRRRAIDHATARYVKVVSGCERVGVSMSDVASTGPGTTCEDGEWL